MQSHGFTLSDVAIVLKEYAIDIKPDDDDDDEDEEKVIGTNDKLVDSVRLHKIQESALLSQWADELVSESQTNSSSSQLVTESADEL